MSTIRIVVLAAAGLLLLSGTAFGLTEALRQERRLRTIVRTPVHQIVVHSEAGDVDIRAGLTPHVVIDRRDAWLVSRPEVGQRLREGVLELDGSCSGLTAFVRCRSDLRLAVPPDVDVTIRTETGDVDLRGLRGRTTVRTEQGDIRAHRIETVVVNAATKMGDIELDLFGELARAAAYSQGGDVKVIVPYGTYRVEAGTRSDGRTMVSGLLRDDLAPQRIEAFTEAGDVVVRAR